MQQKKTMKHALIIQKNKLLGKGTALILPTPSALSTSILSLHAHFVKFCGVDYNLKYALT